MSILVHVLDEQGYREQTDLDGVAELLCQEKSTVWIDAEGHDAAIEPFLQNALKLHPLVIEDIFSERMTPKIEDYGNHLYIVMHGVRRDAQETDSLGTVEVDVVIGRNWVFTHRTISMRSVEGMRDELRRNPRALGRGPAFLAHGLIDRLTDHYLPVVDRFDEEIDELETAVVECPTPELLPKLFAMKRSLQRLRRISVYQREILQRLSRGEFELIPDSALVFYRDIFDHFVRISDLADSYRELINASVDMYMSVMANRTNDIMKVLAIISTIMLPLTFIAGLYGMNFKHMPELDWRMGYPMALGLMGLVAALFIVYFRRKRWI